MKLSKLTMGLVLALSVVFVGCGPKDADIQTSLQKKELSGVVVTVDKGVATLSGNVADDAAKAEADKIAKDEKGVKSVVNNIASAPVVVTPMPESVNASLDAAAQQKVKDGLKDIKGVTVTFTADKAVLSGSVTNADRMKIMQMLASANVKSDVSGLSDKK